jgi:iron only hydrogenase large subunit-like protein
LLDGQLFSLESTKPQIRTVLSKNRIEQQQLLFTDIAHVRHLRSHFRTLYSDVAMQSDDTSRTDDKRVHTISINGCAAACIEGGICMYQGKTARGRCRHIDMLVSDAIYTAALQGAMEVRVFDPPPCYS